MIVDAEIKVPFLSLADTNAPYKQEYLETLSAIVDSGWYIQGPALKEFEHAFSAFCAAKYCVGVGTGLDALILALRALNIKPGDEILLSSHTFIATFLAISNLGAKPVPIEPEAGSMNINVEQVEGAITPATKAIIAVHMYGRPCDMDTLRAVANKHSLTLIEDAAQAHGAVYKSNPIGGLGDVAAFSFYPAKTLGALGDGGAILSNNSAFATRVRTLANYGSDKKYHHIEIGVNSRLDELQAAFLQVKLKHLKSEVAKRRVVAAKYVTGINNEAVTLPFPDCEDYHSAWHLFVVRSERRDELAKHLATYGIETGLHYPIPFHKQPAYRELFSGQNFPITQSIADTVLSLPMSPTLDEQAIQHVIATVNAWTP